MIKWLVSALLKNLYTLQGSSTFCLQGISFLLNIFWGIELNFTIAICHDRLRQSTWMREYGSLMRNHVNWHQMELTVSHKTPNEIHRILNFASLISRLSSFAGHTNFLEIAKIAKSKMCENNQQ